CRLSWTAVSDRGLIYAVARDITELRAAEDELRTSQQELARANRQLTMGAMSASIAHEINQPLAAIVANGNAGLRWLARATPDLEEARAVFKRIVDDGNRASQVIAYDHRSTHYQPHRTAAPDPGYRSLRAFLLVKRQGAMDHLRKSRPHETHARERSADRRERSHVPHSARPISLFRIGQSQAEVGKLKSRFLVHPHKHRTGQH